MTNKTKGWEKELLKIGKRIESVDTRTFEKWQGIEFNEEEIKQFIQSLLSRQKQEIIKEIEKWAKKRKNYWIEPLNAKKNYLYKPLYLIKVKSLLSKLKNL